MLVAAVTFAALGGRVGCRRFERRRGRRRRPPTATVRRAAATAAVEILPPGDPFAGLTRGEWDARQWQWLVSMPVDINPGDDTTGDRCGYGQSGPVFFVIGSGNGGQRTCVVAEGTAYFVVVATVGVLDRRAAAVLRANRGRTAGLRHGRHGHGDGRQCSRQRG